jgi:Mg-chelatase subunit ChlD
VFSSFALLPERPARMFGGVISTAAILASLLLAGTASVGLAADDVSCGVRPLDVELIIDRSGSMSSEQSGGQTRIYWAKQAANQLVDDLDANGGVGSMHAIGLTSFGGVTATVNMALGGSSAAQAHTAINAISASGNTPLKLGLATGAADLVANQRNSVSGVPVLHVLVMLSDGRPNPDPGQRPSAGEIASYLGSADVAYSIAIGEGGSGSSQIDLGLMGDLANPGANFRHVVEASDLPGLFSSIFDELSCPQIGIDKTPSVDSLPAGGGNVTYTYEVTNTNPDAALHDVTVSDDKCSPVTYVSGDTNGDSKLQSSETWVFSCAMSLSKTTTNVATATGEYNGHSFTALDDAKVVVSEATPTPTPTPTPTATPTATPTSSQPGSQIASPTPEQSVAGGTGTPAPSVPNTAIATGHGSSSAVTVLFALVAMGSLVVLTSTSVAVARRRR